MTKKHHCCKKTSAHSLRTATSEKLSYKKSYNTSQYTALKVGGKGWLASSDFKQTFLKQNLLRKHTSIGPSTFDQFFSEEIRRTTPSVTWTNTDEQFKFLDNKSSDSSRSNATWKDTEYSRHVSEIYSVSSSELKKDETIIENTKRARSQLATPELFLGDRTQTAKTSCSTAPSVKKIPCVNAKKLVPRSTLQTPLCSPLTPVSAPVGFETISFSSSDGYSSFAHCSDAQWSSESSRPASTTVTRNKHFSVFETVAEIETSGCRSSSCPSSPTGQILLSSRAITVPIKTVSVQNNFINNSSNGLQEKELPDSEMKQMKSFAFSKVKNQLALPDIYHLEERQKYAEVNNTNFDTNPFVQEVASLTQENVKKFDLLQLRKKFQSVAEELEITQKNQGITDKDWQRENVVSQTIASDVARLHENQVGTLELNAAQMALESQCRLPHIDTKSLSTMIPLSPPPKNSTEPTMKEIKPPIITKNEAYDFEFNLHQRMGMQQRRPTPVKEVNLRDSAHATRVTSTKVPMFNDRQATCLKLNLGKCVPHKGNGLIKHSAEVQKSQEVPLEDDSVVLAEIKAEDVEKSPVYHNQASRFEVKPTTTTTENEVKSFEAIKKIGTPKLSKDDVASQESHLGRKIVRHGSNFFDLKQQFEEQFGYHPVQNINKSDVLQQLPASALQPSNIEAELINKAVPQEIDIANGNNEIIQLTKAENMQPSPKWIPLQLIETVSITELPFITVEHKKISEENVKRKITSNKLGLQQSSDNILDAPPQSEDMERNDTLLKNTDISHHEDDFLSHDSVFRNGEINMLKEVSVTRFKAEEDNKLNICLTKQHVEIKMDCLPNVVMKSYEHFYSPEPKKLLPKLIRIGEGYKKPRPLYIPFMERDAIERSEMNLRQKLISSLWGSPNLFEKSLETMIPKAPPVPPPIKARATKIEPIGRETEFLDEKVRNHLERHIIQKKLELNWALPTEVQRARGTFVPPAPKLIHSQLKSQSYAHFGIVLTEPPVISNEQQKTLEVNLKKMIINHGFRPIVQKSLINFMESHSMKEAIAPSEIQGNQTLAGNLDCQPKTLSHTGILLLKHGDNGKSTELNKVLKDKLEICIRKHCLEIKMDYYPEIVKEMYKVTYSSESTRRLPTLIAPGRGYKKPRPHNIPFIEQGLIDRLELNLMHKHISQLWRLETLHEKSLEIMMSKELYIPPAIKLTVTKVVPTAVKTYFISSHTRLLLERHITQKKLQQSWGLPLHIQQSESAFIPPAPRLILSKLNPKPDFVVIISLPELTFLPEEQKRILEFNVKKRIVNRIWGLPKVILSSLSNFMPPAPSVKDLIPQREIIKKKKIKRGKLTTPQCDQAIKFVKSSKKGVWPVLACLKLEHEEKLDLCLIKQRLDIKLNHLPSIVQDLYKNTYPSERKNTSAKLLKAGEGLKKTRPGFTPFIEHVAVDHLEMNLRNKHISHLWGFQTLHEESMEIMIPKAPLALPAIKPNRAQMEAVSLESVFLGRDIRGKLERHIIQKKVQHDFGLPSYYQKSMEEFIPAAPKLVPSQLTPQVDLIALIPPGEPSFVDVEIVKRLELNTKKKIINQRWGLPNCIQSSLQDFMAPAPPVNIIMASEAPASKKLNTNNIGIRVTCKTEKPQKSFVQPKIKKLTTAQYESERTKSKTPKSGGNCTFAHLKQEDKDKLDVCLIKQRLEIAMNTLPEIVMECYKITYPPKPKRSLPQLIVPGSRFKKPRAFHPSFIEQGIVDQLELNLKHKQINYLWGLATLHDESLAVMIPSGLPILPAIKANGAQIEPVSREINFSPEVLKDLEMHITQKKLQQSWGLPLHIQRSESAFIPPAPRLILSKLNPKPNFANIMFLRKLTFIPEEHKRKLEFSVKKRTVYRMWGFPKVIQSSLSNFMPPAPFNEGSHSATRNNSKEENQERKIDHLTM